MFSTLRPILYVKYKNGVQCPVVFHCIENNAEQLPCKFIRANKGWPMYGGVQSVRLHCWVKYILVSPIEWNYKFFIIKSISIDSQIFKSYSNRLQSFSIDSNICEYIQFDANLCKSMSIYLNRSRHFWTIIFYRVHYFFQRQLFKLIGIGDFLQIKVIANFKDLKGPAINYFKGNFILKIIFLNL